MLQVRGLRVRYGDAVAVDGVDLHAERGSTVALLGPSGSGKSSILRAVAGLVPVDGGSIEVDGDDVTTRAPERRGVGLMFQDYALFPHRDVGANVGFGVRMGGAGPRDVATRVGEVLELVGLAGYEHRSVASLSGGEQQRVALARALAPSPAVLLLDEPLGSLDRALRERLAVELRAIFAEVGSTVVTVTHDQAEAFTMASSVVLLRAGTVVQAGAPVDVWREPVDAAAARFLGFGNVLPVEVVSGEVQTPWGPVPARRADGPAALVVRPDGLLLGADDGTGVGGVVGPATFRGDHFLVPVVLTDGTAVEVAARSGTVSAPGTLVSVRLDPEHATVTAP